jgi:hypothetical protein
MTPSLMMDIPLSLIKESFLSHGPFIPIARILATAYSFISCSDQPDSVVLAADRRTVSNLKPASKAKREIRDCQIIETYFSLCRKLRADGFMEKCVFVSANKRDFCADEAPLTFHADLLPMTSECHIDFAINLGHAISILDRA